MSVYKEYKGTVWTVLIIAFSVFVYLNTGYTMYDAEDFATVEAALESKYDLKQTYSQTLKGGQESVPGHRVRAREYNVSSLSRAGLSIALTNTDQQAKKLAQPTNDDNTSTKIFENTYLYHQATEDQAEKKQYHQVATYQDGIVIGILFLDGVTTARGKAVGMELKSSLNNVSEKLDPPAVVLRPVITGILGSKR